MGADALGDRALAGRADRVGQDWVDRVGQREAAAAGPSAGPVAGGGGGGGVSGGRKVFGDGVGRGGGRPAVQGLQQDRGERR